MIHSLVDGLWIQLQVIEFTRLLKTPPGENCSDDQACWAYLLGAFFRLPAEV
jgi:hypothetical protein